MRSRLNCSTSRSIQTNRHTKRVFKKVIFEDEYITINLADENINQEEKGVKLSIRNLHI